MSIYLCGNTGIKNRGCEAIIRSTVPLLQHYSGDVTLATLNCQTDIEMTKELGINLLGYNQYPNRIIRYLVGGVRKLNKKSLAGMGIIEKPLFSRLQTDDLCLTIGGDTYCYSRPVIALTLNRFTSKRNIKNILWCCSIGRENLDAEKIEDLKRYYKIFAREIVTYNTLLEAGIPKEKLVKVCDPAFFLQAKEVALPEGFEVGNTVGLNFSQMVIDETNNICYENIQNLITYILEQTSYKICLIPHVYDTITRNNDLEILDRIKKEFPTERVLLEDRELTCEELKYIISQCSYFVGARTHSTIAAYSSCVPTLVMGYSVKSIGIATDLFGTSEGYVLPYQGLKKNDELKNAFSAMMERGEELRAHLGKTIPIYKEELVDAIRHYITPQLTKKGLLCTERQCTGCEACISKCPQHAISMYEDEYGFRQPNVDESLCTNCQVCNKVCPVINRTPDSCTEPQTLLMRSYDTDVRKNSSSGGVFFELAKTVLAQGGYVCGAVFCPQGKTVRHVVSNQLSDVKRMMGSKYAQSDLGDTFSEIKRLLDEKTNILFSGLPCQVEGLRRFLGKDYDNLVCADIICHGICSPTAFREYLLAAEKEHHKSVLDIQMRSKKDGWRNYGVNLCFDDTSELFEHARENIYMRGYLNGLYTRASCYACAFKKTHRVSDLTLGDAWGFEDTDKSDMGMSAVFVHSEKGRAMIDLLADSCGRNDISFCSAVRGNKAYFESTNDSSLQKPFFRRLKKTHSFYNTVNRYIGSGLISVIRRRLIKMKAYLP